MVNNSATQELQQLLDNIRDHLTRAQALMDSINPDSIFGSRVQQLIDELDEQTLREMQHGRQGDAID